MKKSFNEDGINHSAVGQNAPVVEASMFDLAVSESEDDQNA
jgi:hypothetical protein